MLIVSPDNPGAILEEGLVRVRGELAAMGLGTEVRLDGPDTAPVPKATSSFQGALVFERFGDWLRIQAWNSATAVPVTQWIDASDPLVDAEVIAVRAVEALRAALLPYNRSQKEGAPTPTRDAPATLPRSDPPIRTQAHETGDSSSQAASGRRTHVRLRVGPTFASDLGTNALHVGVQAGVAYSGPSASLGAELSASRARVRGDNDDQRAELTRFAALVDGRLRVALHDSWEAFAALGVGALHLRASGIPRPGYVAEGASHTSLVAAGELGVAHWFSSRLAMYLSSRGSLAFDAPVIRVDRRAIATLDRPQLGCSTGILIALD